jgi:hypothetical protein
MLENEVEKKTVETNGCLLENVKLVDIKMEKN